MLLSTNTATDLLTFVKKLRDVRNVEVFGQAQHLSCVHQGTAELLRPDKLVMEFSLCLWFVKEKENQEHSYH